jgi:hypothetical protein
MPSPVVIFRLCCRAEPSAGGHGRDGPRVPTSSKPPKRSLPYKVGSIHGADRIAFPGPSEGNVAALLPSTQLEMPQSRALFTSLPIDSALISPLISNLCTL